jgi:glc operon protein GlcG
MKRSTLLATLLLTTFASVSVRADNIMSRATLTADGAKAIATIAVEYAHAHAAPGAAIAVVDAGGILIYLERLDGTFPNAANISIGKARTAALFGKPTRVFEDAVNKGRYTMLALPEVAPFTPLMGGVPIEVNGQIVGAVGVSGAASAAQDDEIATAAAAQFAKAQSVAATQVIVVSSAQVEKGFHDDATLVSNAEFRVNASHRDGPGEAEVHLHDTDIFYVLKGSAELVTGGEVISPRNTASNEIRGSEIRGGEVHHLAQGDVVTIPRGVPHWFKQVRTPFTYYVVKSTAP